jgi:predicted nucleotidyltransferase
VDWSNPRDVITSRVTNEVACALAQRVGPVTGREASRLVGRSEAGVRNALGALADSGLVTATPSSHAVLYEINREHLAYPAISLLADLRGALIGALRAELADWDPAPVSACLFGSVARGEAGPDSDIDVLLVRPDRTAEDDPAWEAQVQELHRRLGALTGNFGSVVQVSRAEAAALRRRRAPVVAEVLRDGVHLAGQPLEAVFGRARRAA